MALEVLPGVYDIPMLYVHAFLIADDGLTLIDCGLPRRSETVLREVRRLGKQASDLKHIVVTHYHVDHTGSLAALKEASGATVYVHPSDAPYVRGDKPQPGPFPGSAIDHLLAPLITRFGPTPQAAPVDREVTDGEELPVAEGLKVVHTPGHTPGHVCLLMPRHGGVLFVGDAAANVFGLRRPIGMFTVDMAQAKESLRKLAALEFDVACFGHGAVLKGKAHAAFRRFVEKRAR